MSNTGNIKKMIISCILVCLYLAISISQFLCVRPKTEYGEISVNDRLVQSYVKIQGEEKKIRQYFYTMKDCAGLKLYIQTPSRNDKKYEISFYDGDSGSFINSVEFTDKDLNGDDWTNITFDDFVLPEGGYYYFVINGAAGNEYGLLSLRLGNASSDLLGGLYVNKVYRDNRQIAFNELYIYNSENYIIWIFASAVFAVILYFTLWKRMGSWMKLVNSGIYLMAVVLSLFVYSRF